jgi:hypothetical protein
LTRRARTKDKGQKTKDKRRAHYSSGPFAVYK